MHPPTHSYPFILPVSLQSGLPGEGRCSRVWAESLQASPHHHNDAFFIYFFIYFCSGDFVPEHLCRLPSTPLAPNPSVPSTLPPPSPFPPFQLISSCAEAASSICSVLPPQPHFPAISAPISLPSATSTTGPTHSSSPTTNCRH